MAHKYFRMANQQNQQKDIHFAMAQYLLGMGPMPPPHPEDTQQQWPMLLSIVEFSRAIMLSCSNPYFQQ
jgi:hypothetical protein